MTPRQRQVYDCIAHYWEYKSRSPSLKEIATWLKVTSQAAVSTHLLKLVRQGYITRGFCKAFSIHLTDKKPE